MGIHLKHIGRSSSAGSPAAGRHLIGAAVASVLTAAALVLCTAGSAMAASVPPTVASAFTPSEIGAGDSTATALSITIANPNASGTLSGVGFTDTLPAGLTVDNPNGENGTCGSAGVITATPGASAFSLAGGSLKAGVSCTISISVIASQVGVLQNATGPVTWQHGLRHRSRAAHGHRRGHQEQCQVHIRSGGQAHLLVHAARRCDSVGGLLRR
jgi:hypothetical protein